jgi:hypothetical protein
VDIKAAGSAILPTAASENSEAPVDRRRILYVIRFVIAAWLAITGLYGIVMGIYYLCRKNDMVTFIAAQLALYSGMFAFMGWQDYKSDTPREAGATRNGTTFRADHSCTHL